MRYLLILLIGAGAFSAWSKEVKNFNQVLIQNVQKDIQNQNDEEFKAKQDIRRGPASVETVTEPASKPEKLNQVSLPKW